MSCRPSRSHELVAVGQGLGKVPAGVEEDHRQRRVDLRRHVQQHDALGAEGGDQGRPAAQRAGRADQRAQQGRSVEPSILRAEPLELGLGLQEHRRVKGQRHHQPSTRRRDPVTGLLDSTELSLRVL